MSARTAQLMSSSGALDASAANLIAAAVDAAVPTRLDTTVGLRVFVWDEGNSREQLIYGDTGMRNVAGVSDICPTSNGTAGNLTGISASLRRLGYMVTFTVGMTIQNAITAGSSINFGAIPTGFRPVTASDSYTPVIGQTDGAFKGRWSVNHTNGEWGGRIGNGAAGAVVCAFHYSTYDAWPASLPGSASFGSIPYA